MDGYILVDKPAGWTSFDVVAKIRGILNKKTRVLHEGRGFCREDQNKERVSSAEKRTEKYVERATEPGDEVVTSQTRQSDGFAGAWCCRCRIRVGHAGTLDPFATGLLIILIGKATKQQNEFMKKDKWYEVEMTLGFSSSTGDPEGEITKVEDYRPKIDEIIKALKKFTGVIRQVPPAHSAIKIDGKRAYDLARAGKEVKLEPRRVTIHDIKNLSYVYPKVTFSAHVSSGTYIRSLCADLGEELGVGAYTTALRRTKIGDFDISRSLNTLDLESGDLDKILDKMI